MAFAMTPDEIRRRIEVDRAMGEGVEYTPGQKGAVVGALNEWLGGDDNRKFVVAWLFGGKEWKLRSSKELDNGSWHALYKWIGFYQEDGRWRVKPEFPLEASLVLSRAVKDFFKIKPKDRPELEDSPDYPSMLSTATAYLGGIITGVMDEDGNISVVEGQEEVMLPDIYMKRQRLIQGFIYGNNSGEDKVQF